jgi:hypothetical protein
MQENIKNSSINNKVEENNTNLLKEIPNQYKDLDADTLEFLWASESSIPIPIDPEKQKERDLELKRRKEIIAKKRVLDEKYLTTSNESKNTSENTENKKTPPINYIDVTIDDEYMKKNLTPNGGLIMTGGQANWNGEVDIMRYIISDKLSPAYRMIAQDRIDKIKANQEKTYQHESHHILNRENNLTPHLAAKNLREFLAFRVLDELSAFSTGELYNTNINVENIFQALKISEQKIIDSYYGEPFQKEANWYLNQHKNDPVVLSREINSEKYHRILKQYFQIKEQDILYILQKENKMTEFKKIVDNLIIKLDPLINNLKML